MHRIESQPTSHDFALCWQAAGKHLQNQGKDVEIYWLKADLNPPFLEHISFRIANQLFFVRIEDIDEELTVPGCRQGIRAIAEGCNGHGCLLQMRRTNNGWKPVHDGWGLVGIDSEKEINPAELVTDELIEMTEWELQDLAVQVVSHHLTNNLGKEIMHAQGRPELDPAIWFRGDHGPEWVVVRAVRFPEQNAKMPSNIKKLALNIHEKIHPNTRGHFASIAIAASYSNFDPHNPEPLFRGYQMIPRFEGLEDLSGILETEQ